MKNEGSGSLIGQTSSGGYYRWIVCGLLFLATAINYIDRQILALLKETLDKEIGWTNEQFGWVNASFQFAYAFGLLGFGWFIDRYGTKIGYAVSITVWSIAAMAHSAVSSLRGFIVARIFLGSGEGGNFPSAIKAVALWFPKHERAFATSIFNAGTNVGAIMAPALIPWIASTDSEWGWKSFCVGNSWDQSIPWIHYLWGWQAAFILAGILGFLWLALWLPLYNVPERIRRLSPKENQFIHSDVDEEGSHDKMSWFGLLGYRQTWSFVIAKFLTDPVWWFFLIWLPDFFKVTRGLEIKKSWIHIVTIYTIVTILSIFGGWATGYLAKHGWTVTRARKTGMFIFALFVLPVLLVTQVGTWTAVLLIGLAGAAHQAWSANLFTTASDMFPKKAVASVVGIGGMAGSIGGFIFPVVAGMMLDHFKALNNVTTGYAILFGICGSAYLIAFLFNHLLAPRFEQIRLRG